MIKEVPNFEGYFVDQNGWVYSTWTCKGNTRRKPERICPSTATNGYKVVNIRIENKKYRKIGVHRLVCMAFNGEPKEGDTASHLN
jgi:hypothetical protein